MSYLNPGQAQGNVLGTKEDPIMLDDEDVVQDVSVQEEEEEESEEYYSDEIPDLSDKEFDSDMEPHEYFYTEIYRDYLSARERRFNQLDEDKHRGYSSDDDFYYYRHNLKRWSHSTDSDFEDEDSD